MVNYKDVLTGVGVAFAALLLRDIVRTARVDWDAGTVDFNLAGDPCEGLRLGELDDWEYVADWGVAGKIREGLDWHRGVDLYTDAPVYPLDER